MHPEKGQERERKYNKITTTPVATPADAPKPRPPCQRARPTALPPQPQPPQPQPPQPLPEGRGGEGAGHSAGPQNLREIRYKETQNARHLFPDSNTDGHRRFYEDIKHFITIRTNCSVGRNG